MGIQQMMLGGYPVMRLSITSSGGHIFLPEPAPGTHDVQMSASVSIEGGIGPYSYSWTYVSGDAGIQPTGSTTNAYCAWSAIVNKNSSRSAVWRVTVTDSVDTAAASVTVSLSYSTDL